jgi:multicomponent Na+:H+ antiporter subunit A
MLLGSVGILAILAALAPMLHRALGPARRWSGVLFAFVPAGLAVWIASTQGGAVLAGNALSESRPWVEGLSVALAARLDGLSLLFTVLVLGVGAFVLAYASEYLEGHRQLGRFYATLIAFMAAMLGLVLADNLVLLFIFWELTSITSYLLIGFDHDREKARKAALQALLVTGLGGLALLAGLILLGTRAGTWSISDILAGDHGWMAADPATPWIVGLVLLGAFTKSAAFPFHFWLPGAMEAPTPVSAYLHSSTMVKAGVYLAARMSPAFVGVAWWGDALVLFGGFTTAFAAYLATRETYAKRILAYTTVSSLGAMLMLIGLGAAEAAMLYLLAHALFKGTLFLIAGSLDHGAHIKDLEQGGGLARKMPVTAACAALAALSMAGVPATLGFAGKELFLKAATHAHWIPWFVVAVASLSGLFMVTAAWLVGWRAFFGPKTHDRATERVHEAHESGWRILAGPVVLALLGVIAALAPAVLAAPLSRAAAGAVSGLPADQWPALNLSLGYLLKPSVALGISAGAIVIGSALYFTRGVWRRVTAPAQALERVGPQRAYGVIVDGVLAFGRLSTRVLQNGSLSVYIKTIVVTLIALAGWALWRSGATVPANDLRLTLSAVDSIEVATLALMIGGAVLSAVTRSRLAAVAALGAIGYGVAMLFVLYGAPDLAMTQFAVDTLTVVIFVLVVYHLPRFGQLSGLPMKLGDLALSLAFGALMAIALLMSRGVRAGAPVSDAIVERAYTEGFGRNVVNVILVDFRALDTLGEICVLGIAALGVFTLMRLRTDTALQGDAP